MKNFRLSLLAAAALGVAVSAQVFAQGYTGLIPDNTQQAQDKGDETYGGIVAPKPDARPSTDEPQGYTGLLPGKTDKAAEAPPDPYDLDRAKADKPKSAVKYKKSNNPFAPKKPLSNNKVSFGSSPKITYKPGYTGEEFPLTVEHLKLLSTLSANGMDFNRLNAKTEARVGLPPGTSKMLNNLKTPRIDGMLPPEFATKATVDAVMQIVAEREGEDRRKAASAAYDRLSVMADGFRTLNTAPSSLYVKMGASDAYIKERGEGYNKSLDRLQEAMEALQKIKRGD